MAKHEIGMRKTRQAISFILHGLAVATGGTSCAGIMGEVALPGGSTSLPVLIWVLPTLSAMMVAGALRLTGTVAKVRTVGLALAMVGALHIQLIVIRVRQLQVLDGARDPSAEEFLRVTCGMVGGISSISFALVLGIALSWGSWFPRVKRSMDLVPVVAVSARAVFLLALVFIPLGAVASMVPVGGANGRWSSVVDMVASLITIAGVVLTLVLIPDRRHAWPSGGTV